jgi:hypothetical protein
MNRKSVTTSIAGLALGVAGLVGLGAAPAAAATAGLPATPAAASAAVGYARATAPALQRALEREQTMVSRATGSCLDTNTAGRVYTLACNGGDFQNWNPVDSTQLVNIQTDRCLDSDSAGNAYTLPCNGGNFQNWHTEGARIVNNETGLCLTEFSVGVVTKPCGISFQKWDIHFQ